MEFTESDIRTLLKKYRSKYAVIFTEEESNGRGQAQDDIQG